MEEGFRRQANAVGGLQTASHLLAGALWAQPRRPSAPGPKCASPAALPSRVWPPAGSLPGRGGSREGKNQKQIAGVNGAEPRAASAAAV